MSCYRCSPGSGFRFSRISPERGGGIIVNRRLMMMTETAVMIALALALSQLRLFRMPQGGSVTLAMVPILVLAFRWGGRAGVMAGAGLGLLRLVLDAFVVHPAQFILDYPLAFALVGAAGFIRSRPTLAVIGSFAARMACHVATGVIFFASYAPEGTPALTYSLVYNGSFLLPELAITLVAVSLVLAALKSALPPPGAADD